MEPRIIKGKKYLCKKSVTDRDTHEKLFIQGNTYTGDSDLYYPDPNNIKPDDKHLCGFIINELGHSHAWPYIPEQHLWCSDRWTDFFTEL